MKILFCIFISSVLFAGENDYFIGFEKMVDAQGRDLKVEGLRLTSRHYHAEKNEIFLDGWVIRNQNAQNFKVTFEVKNRDFIVQSKDGVLSGNGHLFGAEWDWSGYYVEFLNNKTGEIIKAYDYFLSDEVYATYEYYDNQGNLKAISLIEYRKISKNEFLLFQEELTNN